MTTASPSTNQLTKILFGVVALLLLLYPATALVIKSAHSGAFYLLALFGLLWATFGQQRGQATLDEKRLFFAVSLFFGINLLTYLLSDMNYDGFKTLGKFLNLLLAIPLYFLLKKLKVSQGLFWYGLVLGASVAAGMAIYELIHASGPLAQRRAHGITHPILFGDLALSMGMMALAGWGYFRERSRWLLLLPIMAAIGGLIASFLAAARGGWLAIPVLLLILAWQARKSLNLRHVLTVLTIVVLLPVAAYYSPNSAVKTKVDSAVYNLSHYADSSMDAAVRGTSVGTRLEMWQASWTIFKQNPWLGIGWGHYQSEAQKLVDAGLRHPSASRWNNPHSQYFSSLVNAGLLGFSALLLFLIPLAVFVR
ncbi:MAG: O-antigen ligase family protein, partial [Gammaproteobacteria bacterium]|nr:O-antigen ligase family protein [Gammaproteobacteria bacterium]